MLFFSRLLVAGVAVAQGPVTPTPCYLTCALCPNGTLTYCNDPTAGIVDYTTCISTAFTTCDAADAKVSVNLSYCFSLVFFLWLFKVNLSGPQLLVNYSSLFQRH